MEIVTEGLRFPEGPIAMPDGSVILVEIEAQRLTRVLPDGTKQLVAETGGRDALQGWRLRLHPARSQ